MRSTAGPVVAALGHVGGAARMVAGSASALGRGQVPARRVVEQMYWMGIGSLPLVLLTAALSGIVTSQQGGYQRRSSTGSASTGTTGTCSTPSPRPPLSGS